MTHQQSSPSRTPPARAALLRRAGLGAALAGSAMLIGGACGPRMSDSERQLVELKARFAKLEAELASQRAVPSDPLAAPIAVERTAGPMATVPEGLATAGVPRGPTQVAAGPPAPAPAPDPDAPPLLPVVKVKPIKANPFEGKAEPTIRIGRTRVARPASTRNLNELPDYTDARIDDHGNLVDREGRIIYRAGRDSPPMGTAPEAQQEAADARDEVYDDPHEAPSKKVERALAVPTVEQVKDPTEEYGRGDVVIHRSDRMVDRDEPVIRVEGRPEVYDVDEPPVHVRPRAGVAATAPPVNVAPRGRVDQAPIAVAPAPAAPPAPEVVSAPVPVQPRPGVKAAPGPANPGDPVVYKGRKERKVQALYKKAMKVFWSKDFAKAAKSFERILTRYSAHDLADNALYWLAEGEYAQGHWEQALAWFDDVVMRYPTGNKMPDAMVKAALCYAQMGNTSYAVKLLSEVEALFGSAPVAEVARKRRVALAGGGD